MSHTPYLGYTCSFRPALVLSLFLRWSQVSLTPHPHNSLLLLKPAGLGELPF